MMASENEQEKQWKAKFEALGENMIRNSVHKDRGTSVGISKGQELDFAFRWLREVEEERERRERLSQWYVK
jgi:hypothetical protein